MEINYQFVYPRWIGCWVIPMCVMSHNHARDELLLIVHCRCEKRPLKLYVLKIMFGIYEALLKKRRKMYLQHISRQKIMNAGDFCQSLEI